MKNTIHNTEFIQMVYDPDHHFVIVSLLHNDSDKDIFKADLLTFLHVLKQLNGVKTILWDLSQMDLVLDIELQTWTDEHINQVEVAYGIKKEVFVLPEELVNQVSVELTMDEQHGQKIETHYFSNREEALKFITKS